MRIYILANFAKHTVKQIWNFTHYCENSEKKIPKKSGKVEFSKTFYLKIFHVSVDYACKVSWS